MAFDANALVLISEMKAALDSDFRYSTTNRTDMIKMLAMLQLAVGGSGGGGGGTTAAVVEAGVVAANTSANAQTLTTTTRMLVTTAGNVTTGGSKTIAANSRGYQIIAKAGSFTLDDGTGVTYTSGTNLYGVNREVKQGFRYAAIVVTPSASSEILIEEIR